MLIYFQSLYREVFILKIYEIKSAWDGLKERATNKAYVEYPKRVFIAPTNKNFTNLLGIRCKIPKHDFV